MSEGERVSQRIIIWLILFLSKNVYAFDCHLRMPHCSEYAAMASCVAGCGHCDKMSGVCERCHWCQHSIRGAYGCFRAGIGC